ncbi:integrase [Streptomyces sp. NPDC004546]|uniref:integrase n=1 Tax=Streptomyces sp. NPDC004546 TaxID=3154282 RepID=UPI0033BCA864
MTSTDIVPAGPRPAVRQVETVTTRTGMRLSASAARWFEESVPKSSRDARAWRWQEYAQWCSDADWHTAERGAVASFLAALADRGHPVKTLQAMAGTLRGMRALDGSPLDAEELKAIEGVIRGRAKHEAKGAGGVLPGPLKADGVTPEDLRRMVRTLDLSTPRGARDAVTLLLDWWMAGRCSEPAALNLNDVRILTVELVDEGTGEIQDVLPALEVEIRQSKADQDAEGETVRILAPLDAPDLCPITALRRWFDVLADAGQLTDGPLLRRIDRHGNIGADAAGRRNDSADRQGGITARTVRTLIKTAARAAGLIKAEHEQEVAEVWAARGEAVAAAATAETDTEASGILAGWRQALRKALQQGRRITGHSMRRGFIQAALRSKKPPHQVAAHSRHAPKSRAFWDYVDRTPDWAQSPTLRLRLVA